MMRLYTYQPVQQDEDFFWEVIEMPTGQVIDSFYFEEDASEYMHFLENGGAFAGFTPSFMLVSASMADNLDEAFTEAFALEGATS